VENYSDCVPNLSDIIAFAIASIALLVIPGPAVIYVLNRSVADGRNTALAGVAGLEIGNFMHVIAATLGLSAIIAASATAFSTVKWAGALYLTRFSFDIGDESQGFHARHRRQHAEPEGGLVLFELPPAVH
jgi:threonine/homoserine/homoserine lactone efflux protein